MAVRVPGPRGERDDLAGRRLVCSTPSDHDLLARTCRRDARAFTELHLRYQKLVLARIDRVTRNPDLSAEVAQDVWLEVWRHPEVIDLGRGAVATWLRTVAHRRAVDCVRSMSAAHRRDLEHGLREAAEVVEGPEQRTDVVLQRSRLRSALEQLTEHQRTAVVLRHFADLSHAEIAERLSVPLSTSRSRYQDGFLQLRRLLSST